MHLLRDFFSLLDITKKKKLFYFGSAILPKFFLLVSVEFCFSTVSSLSRVYSVWENYY